jgi:hypothetical protein
MCSETFNLWAVAADTNFFLFWYVELVPKVCPQLRPVQAFILLSAFSRIPFQSYVLSNGPATPTFNAIYHE